MFALCYDIVSFVLNTRDVDDRTSLGPGLSAKTHEQKQCLSCACCCVGFCASVSRLFVFLCRLVVRARLRRAVRIWG